MRRERDEEGGRECERQTERKIDRKGEGERERGCPYIQYGICYITQYQNNCRLLILASAQTYFIQRAFHYNVLFDHKMASDGIRNYGA